MSQQALIIFIKNPELGTAKTRIAQEVGDQKALDIYLELLQFTREVTMEWEGDRYLYYATFIDQDDEWPSELYQKRLQEGSDLGDKIASAFSDLSDIYDKVIIIGSDCYQLTSEIIDQAFEALDNFDVVIGPSLDGGYYLLGLNSFYPHLFQDMPWSTDRVTPITIERIKDKELGLSYHLLEELRDIDYYADWVEQQK